MAGAPRSGAERRRRQVLVRRVLLSAATALGAGATGLWWDHARSDGLAVGAELTVLAEVDATGTVVVTEQLAFDDDRLGEERLVRTIDPPGGGRVSVAEIDASDRDEVLVVPRPDDGVTLTVGAEAGSPVVLEYEVRGATEHLDLGTLNAAIGRLEVRAAGGSEPVAAARSAIAANEHIIAVLGSAAAPDTDGDDVPWDAIGAGVGVLVLAAWTASRLAARSDATAVEAVEGGLPSSHSPAEVGWLLRYGRVTVADLAATVVDLTARGFVVPFHRGGGLVLGRGRPAVDLDPHESLVLDWLFAGDAREVDLDAKRAAIGAAPSTWSDLWSRFVDEVERAGRDDALLERDVASPAVLAVAGCGLAVLVAGVVGAAHGYRGWLVCVLAGSLVVAGATAVARRSPMGATLAARWEAFGAMLRAGTDITPHALSYAVTLGEQEAATALLAEREGGWPAQLIHDEVERHVTGWRMAFLTATSVRGQPSERVRAFLSMRALANRDLVGRRRPS